jgi:hypothetical protein
MLSLVETFELSGCFSSEIHGTRRARKVLFFAEILAARNDGILNTDADAEPRWKPSIVNRSSGGPERGQEQR